MVEHNEAHAPMTSTGPFEPFDPEHRLPASYVCLTCNAGGLILDKKTMRYKLTAESQDADEVGILERWEGQYRFSCLLQCSNSRCEELLSCGGTMMHDYAEFTYSNISFWNICTPMSLVPLRAGRGAFTKHTDELDSSDQNLFLREGTLWMVRFQRKEARIKNLTGMRILQTLLSAPDKEIPVEDLAGGPRLAGASDQEALDGTAVRSTEKRLKAIKAELQRARANRDHGKTSELRDEETKIRDYIRAGTGRRGRPRNLSDSGERARTAVGQAIKAAMVALEKAHPAFHQHLKESLREPAGARPRYAPDPPTIWRTQ